MKGEGEMGRGEAGRVLRGRGRGWRNERRRVVSPRTAAAAAAVRQQWPALGFPPRNLPAPRSHHRHHPPHRPGKEGRWGQGRAAGMEQARAPWRPRRCPAPAASRAPSPVVSGPHACCSVTALTGAQTSESPSQRLGVGGWGGGDGLATLGRGRKLDARDTWQSGIATDRGLEHEVSELSEVRVSVQEGEGPVVLGSRPSLGLGTSLRS